MMADTSAGTSNAGGSRGGQTGAASRMAAQPRASPGKIIRDPEMDEDVEQAEADRKQHEEDGDEGVDVDEDAMAYIRSR